MANAQAFTRPPSPHLQRCELTYLPEQPIDAQQATKQHEAYERALVDAGLEVIQLPPIDAYPDGVFIEDAAVLLADIALITRPGKASRRGEIRAMRRDLAGYFEVIGLQQGNLDGGDVLRIGREMYVGRSTRSDGAALVELKRRLGPMGWAVRAVQVVDCLHLKTGISCLGLDAAGTPVVLINPKWIDPVPFDRFQSIKIDPDEPFAANVLPLQDRMLASAAHPRTNARLRHLGYRVIELDISEFEKAEAGLTCLSLISHT